jgi:glycosyltransferase involved in cell wall biosynthesis
MKNVLFISYDGMTDPLGQSQVIPYLTGLTHYGYRFTILSCEKSGRFVLNKSEVENLLKPYPIKWAPLSYHKRPPVISTVYDITMLKRKARSLHSTEKFDMVHTRPGIPALTGLWMKKKYGIKFLNDIREFYADSRVEGEMWNQNNFFYRVIYHYFKRKEDQAIELNDGIVCLTRSAETIVKKWPLYKKQIPLEVIPCSVDLDLFDPGKINMAQRSKYQSELHINGDDVIFSYLGSIGSWYLTRELMRFFKMVSEKMEKSKFLFISPDRHEIILEEAKKAGLAENRIRIRHAGRNEVPILLSLSKYSAFFIKPCYSKLSSSPTKHAEIMAMGIPVISNSGVGDIKEIVERFHSGLILNRLDEKELNVLAQSLSEGKYFDPVQIRKGAEEIYNLKEAVEKYRLIYDSIMN